MHTYRNAKFRYSYPDSLIRHALKLLQTQDVKAVRTKLNLPLSTLYRWRRKHRAQVTVATQSSTIAVHDLGPAVDTYETIANPIVGLSTCSSNVKGDLPNAPVDYDERFPPNSPYPRLAATPKNITSGSTLGDKTRTSPPRVEGNSTAPIKERRASRRVRERLARARFAIDRNYNTPITGTDLALIARMSRYHFIHSYKRLFGESPYRYLLRVRVDKAATLLRDTSETAECIAAAVGFDSYSTLSKAFKSIRGQSVYEYCRSFIEPRFRRQSYAAMS